MPPLLASPFSPLRLSRFRRGSPLRRPPFKRRRNFRLTTPPAAISPRGMPAPSVTPVPPPPIYMDVLKLDPKNPDLLSRTFLSVLTDGDIDQAEQARRAHARCRSQRQDLPSGHRHSRAEAEALRRRQAAFRAVGARPGHRSDRGVAVGLGARRRRRRAWRGRRASTSCRARTGTASSRICMPA